MKSFAGNLIARHTMPQANVSPRLRGRFEPDTASFSQDNVLTRHDLVSPDADPPGPEGTIPGAREELPTGRKYTKPPDEPTQTINESPKLAGKLPLEAPPEPVKPAFDLTLPVTNVFDTRGMTLDGESTPETGQTFSDAGETERQPLQYNFNRSIFPASNGNQAEGHVLPVADIMANNAEATQRPGQKPGDAQEQVPGEHRWINSPKSEMSFKNPEIKLQNIEVNSVGMSQTGSTGTPFSNGVSKPFGEAPKPVVRVSIGRIEVRAIMPAAPPPVKSREPSKPRLSLDDFLNQHKTNEQ